MSRYIQPVEPYVIAADVYAVAPHAGRGGWSWYTGSAGWMYRLVVESLLGLRLEVDRLRLDPVIPRDWPAFDIDYRYRKTVYHIHVRNLGAATAGVVGRARVTRVVCDGVDRPEHSIPLHNDGVEHHAEIELGGGPETLPAGGALVTRA